MPTCIDTPLAGAPYRALPISQHVYWVGAVDWALRDFHGYTTEQGTTYNAYLIMADKITLIDTVKRPFADEMFARIASVVDPAKIDIIVSNHAEMDHSGCLPEAMALAKGATLYASPQGVKALSDHFHMGCPISTVKDGERIDLGNMSLTCLETRMLHWPDSMISYLDADRVLFTNDAFGMHYASAERFDDQVDQAILYREAKNYFANILTPYSSVVLKLLDRWQEMGLPVDLIAPDHGPIWREDTESILGWYAEWAEQRPTLKALVIYDTMWGSTEKMARALAEGLAAGGAQPKLIPLAGAHRSDVALELLDAGALLVGSPTLNNNLFPTVADVLYYLKGLRKQHLIGLSFGSCGWGGEAVAQVQELLTSMKVDTITDPLKVKYVPTADVLARCVELGEQVAAALRARTQEPIHAEV
jgi:flavorubredoxin